MSNVIPSLAGLASATIDEGDVTIPRLSSLLETAFIDNRIDDDGDIYIVDGVDFPMWAHIVPDRKLIMMFTYWAGQSAPAAEWLAQVNDMNRTVMVPQFCYRDDAVWGNYWFSYDGGLNVRQFIKMLRTFGSAFRAGIMLHDRESHDAPTSVAPQA